MQKTEDFTSSISNEKEEAIVAKVNEIDFDDGRLKGGLYGLCATAKSFADIYVQNNYHDLISSEVIKAMFKALIKIDVPPTRVILGKEKIYLEWFPNGRMPIDNKEDYINLLRDFQIYIDSIPFLDLEISYDEYERLTEDEFYPDDIPLPLYFNKKTFLKYQREEIIFIDDYRHLYYLGNDANGDVCITSGEELMEWHHYIEK